MEIDIHTYVDRQEREIVVEIPSTTHQSQPRAVYVPRQSLRRGRRKSIFPQGQLFSKVESANIGAFE